MQDNPSRERIVAEIHEHIRQQEEVQGRQFTAKNLIERLMSTGTQGALDLRREYYRVFEPNGK
jgi:hypothetical protein